MDTTTIISDAVKAFESNIFDNDARGFDALSIQNVVESARIIELEREERQRLCNLRRVEPLLKKLQELAGAVRKLPQSSCPEHYIWGPVKIFLEIANEDDEALQAILDRYAQLTSGLRFLGHVLAVPHLASSFHEVIAYTLSDVLDFHTCVYQVLRRGGWQMLFSVSWAEVAPVLDCIIKRFEYNCSLVDRVSTGRSNVVGEVNISDNATAHLGDRFFDIQHATFAPLEEFSTAREFREKVLDDLQAKQKRRAEHQLQECIKWLDLQSLDRKTTLATYIVDHARLPVGGMMLYFLCSHETPTSQDVLNGLLSVLIAQILRSSRHLVPFVFETYVKSAEQPALKMPILLRQLLSCLSTTYVVIDGLNECHSDTQSRIVNKLDSLVAQQRDGTSTGLDLKILISSQEAKGVPHKLSRQSYISLTEEHVFVSRDIKAFTMNAISSLEDRGFDQKVVEGIASAIMKKANGMFLWVKLVLLTLLEQESLFEIRTALDRLPVGLAGIYKILLERLEKIADDRQKPRIRMIFYWVLFALRPMKVWEICDALVIGGSNLVLDRDHTMLNPRILDICKPLIEVHKDQTVAFVHFSVKSYLLDIDSGPFVLQRDALTHVASTCLRYLFTCEDFFFAKQSTDTYRQIILQLHSLFPYVAETWKSHFTALAMYLSTPSITCEALLSNLLANESSFEDRSKILSCRQKHQRPPSPQYPAQIRTDREVVRQSILQDLHRASGGNKGSTLNDNRHDLVTQAFMCFQSQFEQLLMDECPHSLSVLGVSHVDFDLFRDRYASTAFLCRRGRCQYSILGFSSVEERARHERSHEVQFCCPELGCAFQETGFPSRAALRSHVQRYHRRQEENAVPRLLTGRHEATSGLSSRFSDMGHVQHIDRNQEKEATETKVNDPKRMFEQQQMRQVQEPFHMLPRYNLAPTLQYNSTSPVFLPGDLTSTSEQFSSTNLHLDDPHDAQEIISNATAPSHGSDSWLDKFDPRTATGLDGASKKFSTLEMPLFPPTLMSIHHSEQLTPYYARRQTTVQDYMAQRYDKSIRRSQESLKDKNSQETVPREGTVAKAVRLPLPPTSSASLQDGQNRQQSIHQDPQAADKTSNRVALNHLTPAGMEWPIKQVLPEQTAAKSPRAFEHQAQRQMASTPISSDVIAASQLRYSPETDQWLKPQFQRPQGQKDRRSAMDDSIAYRYHGLSFLHNIDLSYPVYCVGFSPDGRYLAIGCGYNVGLFNPQTGSRICYLTDPGHEDAVLCLCFSRDGTYLATGMIGGGIRIWDIETCQLRFKFPAGDRSVTSVVFVYDDNYIASTHGYGSVMVWAIRDGLMVRLLETNCTLTSISVSHDNRYLAAGSLDGDYVYIWDNMTESRMITHPASSRHMSGVNQVMFSSNGDRLASCGNDRVIKIWEMGRNATPRSDVSSYKCVQTLEGHEREVNSICFTHGGSRIISGSADTGIGFWNLVANPPFRGTFNQGNIVTHLASSANGELLASVSTNRQVRIWRYDALSAERQWLISTIPSAPSHRSSLAPQIPSEQNDNTKCICGLIHNVNNHYGRVSCQICGTCQHIGCYYKSGFITSARHLCVDCIALKMAEHNGTEEAVT